MISSNPRRYVVIDVETTGLSPNRGDHIIEIGAPALVGDEYDGEFHSLVDAGRRISFVVRKISGVTNVIFKNVPAPARP